MRTIGILSALAALACGACRAQAADDCKPSSTNIQGAKFPCVHPDNRATFQLLAPDAKKVQVRLGQNYDMVRDASGMWSGTIPPLTVGFHYYYLLVDGVAFNDPASEAFYGVGRESSGIEIPEKDADAAYYQPQNVAHGGIRERWYFSKVTGAWRRCFVYAPPDYDSNTKARYPVLYLLHGGGEDERGWTVQGRLDFILDNLIAAKKAKPMLIVLDSMEARKPGERGPVRTGAPVDGGAMVFGGPAERSAAQGGQAAPAAAAPPRRAMNFGANYGATFTDVLLGDLIPMIESTYRTLPGRENRAMAGLSMGGMQTLQTTLTHLDQFAYIGAFSPVIPDATVAKIYDDPAGFNQKVKLLFLATGTVERDNNPAIVQLHEALGKAAIKHVYYESQGTAHEWLTWRRSLREFAPLLFR